MNMFQLNCFLAVANSLSFARAAEQMNVSQPAITHQIKMLETELNVKLFRRSTRLVEITAEGQAFVTDAKSMVAIAEQAKRRFQDPEDRPIEQLSIGCSSYIQLALFSDSLNELAGQYQNLHPRLLVVPHDQLFHLLETETADAIFDVREGGDAKEKLTFQELGQSAIVCVCRRDHPLAEKERVRIPDLGQEKLIFCDPINVVPAVASLQWKLGEGRSTADIHFCASIGAAAVLAGAGFGAAILPELLVPAEKDIVCIPLEGAPRLSFGLFYKNYPGDTVLKRFVQIAKKQFGKTV